MAPKNRNTGGDEAEQSANASSQNRETASVATGEARGSEVPAVALGDERGPDEPLAVRPRAAMDMPLRADDTSAAAASTGIPAFGSFKEDQLYAVDLKYAVKVGSRMVRPGRVINMEGSLLNGRQDIYEALNGATETA